MRILPSILAAIACLVATSIACAAVPVSDDRPTVTCSVGMVADIARGIAGDHAVIETLVGPGIDPHLHKPTRSDIARIMKADLVVAVGLHLEGRMDTAFTRAEKSGRRVLRVGDALPADRIIQASKEEADPHAWMDPRTWTLVVDPIAEALGEVDPPNAPAYRANAAKVKATLADLDRWSAERLATVPSESRVLVTAHDAFEYFGRRYGFEVVGIQGISTESEAGVRDIERIVDLLVDRRVPAVFVESTVPPRHVQALVAGARARGHEVTVGGELFSDAMGRPGTHEGTYEGMIDHNVTMITRALGGDAPARGREGRLAGGPDS